MSFKDATDKWYSTIHHGTATDADFTALRTAAGTNKKDLDDAETKIRMYNKRKKDTPESKAINKVIEKVDTSSVGNHLLGWLSPKRAR